MQSIVRKEILVQVEMLIEPDENGFHAYCPALKGLHVGGETEEEAIKNAEDAAIAYLESFIKHNDPLPLGIIVKEPKTSKVTGKLKHHTVNLAINCA